jgi:PAS domain S-box-containing protein
MAYPGKIKILAVDDNQNNLIALESVFYGSNYQMIEARSGAEAIELVKAHDDIALILLDVQMPEMDGYETATLIKKIEACRDIPIIFITAFYREDPYVRKGYEAGAIDYFGKPFDPELLKMKVDIYSSFRQRSFLLREREKRIAETEELLKASKKLSSVFENMSVGVLISDADGKIFQCNETASDLLNSSKAEGEDHYGELIAWWNHDGSILKEPKSILWEALKDRKSVHNQKINLRCPDGSMKALMASSSPLLESNGELRGAVIILSDASASREFEEEFEHKISKLISIGVELEHQALRP